METARPAFSRCRPMASRIYGIKSSRSSKTVSSFQRHSGKGRVRAYLSSKAEDADANEENNPLWLSGEHKPGAGEPHEEGADDGRVERKVGDRVGRRGTSTDGADGDVGCGATEDAQQCETDGKEALLLSDAVDGDDAICSVDKRAISAASEHVTRGEIVHEVLDDCRAHLDRGICSTGAGGGGVEKIEAEGMVEIRIGSFPAKDESRPSDEHDTR